PWESSFPRPLAHPLAPSPSLPALAPAPTLALISASQEEEQEQEQELLPRRRPHQLSRRLPFVALDSGFVLPCARPNSYHGACRSFLRGSLHHANTVVCRPGGPARGRPPRHRRTD